MFIYSLYQSVKIVEIIREVRELSHKSCTRSVNLRRHYCGMYYHLPKYSNKMFDQFTRLLLSKKYLLEIETSLVGC